MNTEVTTGWGNSDTHSPVLSDGRVNTHSAAGVPYSRISANDIFAMVANPPEVEKTAAQWIIPSEYNRPDARAHQSQKENGRFHWLAIDIDEGSPPLGRIREALATALGDAWGLIYSSKGASPANLKWRVLIPLGEPLTGEEYGAFQASLFDAFNHLGIVVDRSLERPGQLIYLPNRGAHYEWAAFGSTLFFPKRHPIAQRASQYLELDRAQKAAASTMAHEGPRSHLRAFRQKHSIDELLSIYGFEQSPSNPDLWRHPAQSSSHYGGMRIMRYLDADRWVCLSETINSWGIGRPSAGGRSGDAFDLYVAFSCAGDRSAAESYARQCLAEEDEKRFGDATIEHGRELWEAYCRARQEETDAMAKAIKNAIALPDDEGNNDEWDIDWPPGAVGELAKWIYLSSSRPVKQYAIAAAFYFFSVSGRKYNVDGKGLNLFMLLVGGTGRGKGIVKTAVDRLVAAVIKEAQDPMLGAPFSHEISVSEAGIRRALSKQNPICAYEEELGMTLLPLTSVRANATEIGLRKMLTRLFDSGRDRSFGIKQASSEDNTKAFVSMPCMTIAGDTQPHVFRGLLGGGMLDSGFAPRMVPFFYYGKRKYHNKESARYVDPPALLVQAMKGLLEYSLRSAEGAIVDVGWMPDAKQAHEDLDIEYTDKINADEPGAEMFNRAGDIVARVAALLAVGENHLNPVITMELFNYAKRVVWKGLSESQKILASGAAGSGESVRIFKFKEAMRKFVSGAVNPDVKIRDYRTPKAIVDNTGLINERFFIKFLGDQNDFKGSDHKTTEATVRETIKEAIAQGLVEETIPLMLDKRTKQKVYAIGPDF